MAASKRLAPPPPSDIEITAGSGVPPGPRVFESATAHSMPAMMPAVDPEPAQERTWTVTMVVPSATP